MGFFNEIKKVLFGAKAVTKSAGRKAAAKGKEVGRELADDADEWLDKAKEKSADFSRKAKERAGDLFEDAKDFAEESWDKAEDKLDEMKDSFRTSKEKRAFSEDPMDDILREQIDEDEELSSLEDEFVPEQPPRKPETPPSELDQLGEKVKDTTSRVGKKVLDTAEDIGEELSEKGSQAFEKFKDVSEDVGEELFEKGGQALDKAKELGKKFTDKAESLFNKAQEEAAKENLDETLEETKRRAEELEQKVAERGKRSNAENLKRDEESLLGDKGGFFERAKRYAEGDYHASSKPKISKDPNYEPPKKEGKVKGFEDLDGDGDEIIDDAILDDE